MDVVASWRELQVPRETPQVLTLGQVLAVCQALGLSLDRPSVEVTVQAVGEYVVLKGSGLCIFPRAEWRQKLDSWRPAHLLPGRE